jgi:hypothetical protein
MNALVLLMFDAPSVPLMMHDAKLTVLCRFVRAFPIGMSIFLLCPSNSLASVVLPGPQARSTGKITM